MGIFDFIGKAVNTIRSTPILDFIETKIFGKSPTLAGALGNKQVNQLTGIATTGVIASGIAGVSAIATGGATIPAIIAGTTSTLAGLGITGLVTTTLSQTPKLTNFIDKKVTDIPNALQSTANDIGDLIENPSVNDLINFVKKHPGVDLAFLLLIGKISSSVYNAYLLKQNNKEIADGNKLQEDANANNNTNINNSPTSNGSNSTPIIQNFYNTSPTQDNIQPATDNSTISGKTPSKVAKKKKKKKKKKKSISKKKKKSIKRKKSKKRHG
jgi:hypothetical protein